MIRISSQFDSGAIEVLDCTDPSDIRLSLRADNAADFRQWFHFRLQGARGQACTLSFDNAGASAYPGGWDGYRVVASYDRR
ncbi:MAG TPA: M14-type cytosolic carboxypeptidase, partial [Methyloversatilis sp.]